MKIKESYWKEDLKADKNDTTNWSKDARRQTLAAQSETANKLRQTEPLLKEEMKFANILESSAKLQKPDQKREDSGEERRDDEKSKKKSATHEKDVADNLAEIEQKEKYGSFGGQAGGEQSGFGMGGNVGQLNLGENFAARSILHIADLERLVSTIRTQINLGGKREITLQLKHSVLEGLKVKILTDPATRVQIEFLAANEKVRSQLEEHSQELGEILRGRGINLGAIRTSVNSDEQNRQNSEDKPEIGFEGAALNSPTDDSLSDNTFERLPENDGTLYKA